MQRGFEGELQLLTVGNRGLSPDYSPIIPSVEERGENLQGP